MAMLTRFQASPGANIQARALEDDSSLGEFLDDALGGRTGFDVAVNGNPTTDMNLVLRNDDLISITPRKLASAQGPATWSVNLRYRTAA